MVHANCAVNETAIGDFDARDDLSFRSWLVIQILEVDLDTELLKNFKFVTLLFFDNEMPIDQITVKLA